MPIVATNLFRNPDAIGTTQFSASGGAVSNVGGKVRFTATGGVTGFISLTDSPGPRFTLSENMPVGSRIVVTNPEASTIWARLDLRYYTSGGSNIATTVGTTMAIPAGGSVILENYGTVPAGPTITNGFPTLYLFSSAGGAVPTASLRIDMSEPAFFLGAGTGTSTPVPFFSGSSADSPGYLYDWLGTPDASPSTMSTYTVLGTKKMWFGSEGKFQAVPLPATGMGVSRGGYGESLDYQNGRVGIVRSMQNHKTYQMEFPVQEASTQDGLDVFAKYAGGYYGDCDSFPMFFADPMHYDQNLMPEGWASPYLYRRGWAPIVSGHDRSTTYYNAATNPSVENNATGYAGVAGTSGVISAGRSNLTAYSGAYSYRVTWSTGTTVVSGGINYTGTPYMYTTGAAILYVQCSKIQRVQLTMNFKNASNVSVGTVTGVQTVLAANTWTKLEAYASTLPVGTVTVDLEVRAVAGTSGSNWVGTNWLAIDAVAVMGVDIYGDFFDGDTAGARWQGVRGSSATAMTKPRLRATLTTNAAPVQDLPPGSITYEVTSIPNSFPTTAETYGEIPYAIIPIPPGYQLTFGWTGSVTGSAQVVVQSKKSAIVPSDSTTYYPAPLTINDNTRMNLTVPANDLVDYVKIYINRTTSAASTITIESMMAQLWPVYKTPVMTGRFIAGKGHRGLKFSDEVVVENYVIVDPNRNVPVHYKGMSTTLMEAQDRG